MARFLNFKPGAVDQYFPDGKDTGAVIERHSSTCFHCQKITEFPSMRAMMEHVEICRGCMRLICLGCAGKPCRPWEKEIERMENEHRLRAAVERATWGCYA